MILKKDFFTMQNQIHNGNTALQNDATQDGGDVVFRNYCVGFVDGMVSC